MKIPVTVLTGYLGAGKTTLLGRLLASLEHTRFAVIVNEFAELGIDAELIEQRDEQIVQLSNGCLCCSVRGDLLQSLEQLLARGGFDALIIETTGLADPAPIVQTFMLDDDLNDALALQAVVCVVDGLHVREYWNRHPEVVRQLAFADVVLLNKTDLLDAEQLQEVERLVRRLSPQADLHRTQRCAIDPALLSGHAGELRIDQARSAPPLLLHRHDDSVSSVSLASDRAVIPDRFMAFIRALQLRYGQDLLRYKGVLALVREHRRFVFQGVQAMVDGDVQRPWGDDEPRHSRLVFIGRGLDPEHLQQGFTACLAEP